MLRACAKKADHAAGERLSTTPSGFVESRISTDPPATATSTQLPLPVFVLMRHSIRGFSKSATCPPPRRVADLRERKPRCMHTECPASWRERR